MFVNQLRTHGRSIAIRLNSTYYVTTPIFYVNASPHIGHLYSAVIADAICRYQRLRQPNGNVYLCTGTDEHGMKVQQAAASQNTATADYCSTISALYRQLFEQAGVSNTDFVRTTDQRHKQAVQHFWTRLKLNAHIYSAQYSGWYCVSDETFLSESLTYVDEAGKRYSSETGHTVEWTEERNYMFKLSSFQTEILRWLKLTEPWVRPVKFAKILAQYLDEPLADVSVSRPSTRVSWAIPVPDDPSQTIYVWLDALVNYLTSTGYPHGGGLNCWPPSVQVIGKDILKFHGIYWPAFLMAADLEPPKQLFVHSHWTVDSQKMSKSKGNVVNPMDAAELYTMEGLRYFLLREGVAHSDGNYSSVKAQHILNAELADTFGNLLSRACARALNPRQIYPALNRELLENILQLECARRLQDALQELSPLCEKHYADNNFYLVVDAVMAVLRIANNFFETCRPWELKSKHNCEATQQDIGNSRKLETIITMTMDTLRLCGIVLQPIIPAMSSRLLDKLNVPQSARLWADLNASFASGCYTGERPLANTMDAFLFRRIMAQEDVTKSPQTNVARHKRTQIKNLSQ